MPRQESPNPEVTGPFAFLSRRRYLKLCLGAGGAVLLGASSLAALRGSAPEISGLSVLGAHEYRTLTALARVHLPEGGAFEQGAEGLDLARAFDQFLVDEPAENVQDLRRALTLFEFGPLLFDKRLKTFSNLSVAEQEAHWRSWSESDLLMRRQVAFAFRKFLSFVFYDTPAVWKHIGYGGPSLWGMPK